MDFETKPVKEIRAANHTTGKSISAFRAAFAELPEALALFLPKSGRIQNLNHFATSRQTWLARLYSERKIHTHVDHEKDGIWLWWEPRETR